MAPGSCATHSMPTPCCAGWSPITPAPSSKPKDALSSVLTCCDMTTSPDGELMPVEQRLSEIQDR
jgi:hypothetical protein